MKTIKLNRVNIGEIVNGLKTGGLVILPTETLYAACVDATNPSAVVKLNLYKARPFGKPYSVAVADQQMAEKYVHLNDTADNLYRTFLPGPLTVVSAGKHQVAPGVESENGTLGIRIPDYPLLLKVVKKLGRPITATSANASYHKRPYQISDILDNLSRKQLGLIDLIIDAGRLPPNEPSTVIDTTLDDPAILRQGEIRIKNSSEILSRNPENTQNLAKELWQKYANYFGRRAIIFALEGPMGAGKTVFTKGLAKAMGISEHVVSPTYDLELTYENKLTHIDAWRMAAATELTDLGFKQMVAAKTVLAIEWAEKVADLIREHNEEAIIIWVKIKYGNSTDHRLISWGAL